MRQVLDLLFLRLLSPWLTSVNKSNRNPHPSTTSGSRSTASALKVVSAPSQHTNGSQRGHFLPTPQRPGLPESLTPVRQLRPTFTPAIVRTPDHYDSQPVVPSPRVTTWDITSDHNSTGVSPVVPSPRVTAWDITSDHNSTGVAPVVPSPCVLPWNNSSQKLAPRNSQSSPTESSRMDDTSSVRGRQAVQRSYLVPEPARPTAQDAQNLAPVVPSGHSDDHHPNRSASTMPNLPQFVEESGTFLRPLIGTVSSASASTATLVAPDGLLPPSPRISRSPSLRHRHTQITSRISSDSFSDTSDSGDRSPRHSYRSRNPLPMPPQERRDPGFSLPPP